CRRRSGKGGAQRRELPLQLDRHRLFAATAHELPQALLEAVTTAAVTALVEVPLGLGPLGVAQDTIEEGLHDFLALLAEVFDSVHHSPPPPAVSASSRLRIRRPRCRRDMTVPIGTSRMCAASA